MSGIDALAKEIAEREGRLHILVNNAGVSWGAPIDDYPESGWDKVLDTNVKAPFFLIQKLLPLLEAGATAEDPARVINVGSIDGLRNPVVRHGVVRAVEGCAAHAHQPARRPAREAQHHPQRDRPRPVPDVDAQHRRRRGRRRGGHRLGRRGRTSPRSGWARPRTSPASRSSSARGPARSPSAR